MALPLKLRLVWRACRIGGQDSAGQMLFGPRRLLRGWRTHVRTIRADDAGRGLARGLRLHRAAQPRATLQYRADAGRSGAPPAPAAGRRADAAAAALGP